MADDLRVETLKPQAAPVNTYAVPEQRNNNDIRFKAAQLQNIFAKGQKQLDAYQQQLIQQQQEQYATEAAFRADNAFAEFKANTWELTNTTDPEQIEGALSKAFNEKFGGLYGDDQGDPWLAAAMADRYRAYVPKAIEQAGINRNERRKVTFLGDITTNVRNTLQEAEREGFDTKTTYGLLDEIFTAAKGNKNGVTGAQINAAILAVGLEDDLARNLIMGYAAERKLDQTSNPEYEKLLTDMKKKGAFDAYAEWEFKMREKLQQYKQDGLVNQIKAHRDEIMAMGLKYDKKVNWYFDYLGGAEGTVKKAAKKQYDAEQVNKSVLASREAKRVVQLDNYDGDPVAATKVKQGLDTITDPEQEGTIEANGDILTWHQNGKIKSMFDANTAALKRLDDNSPLGTDKDGKPIWTIQEKDKEGNVTERAVTRAEFNAFHVDQFTELADRVVRAAGTDGLRNQLGDDAFRKWQVIQSLRRAGRSNKDIGRFMAAPKLSSKVSKDEIDTVMKELNQDQTDWFFADTGAVTDDARNFVRDYINYVVSMNDGVRDPNILSAIAEELKAHWDVIEFGESHSLINTTDPSLVRAFGRKGKDKDGNEIVTPISKSDMRKELGVGINAYYKQFKLQYDGDAAELKKLGLKRSHINPEDIIIRKHPNKPNLWIFADNMGNVISAVTAEDLAKTSRQTQANEANSDAEQTYMQETKTYVEAMLKWTEDSDYDMTRKYREEELSDQKKKAQLKLDRIRSMRDGTYNVAKGDDELAGYDNWVPEERLPSDEVLKLQEEEAQAVLDYLNGIGVDTSNLVDDDD